MPFVFCKTASLQFRAATQGAFIVPGRFPDAASVELYFTVLGERFDYQDACKGKLKEGSKVNIIFRRFDGGINVC